MSTGVPEVEPKGLIIGLNLGGIELDGDCGDYLADGGALS